MAFFEIVGMLTTGVIALLALRVASEIAGNIYGGVTGAYRIRKFFAARDGAAKITHLSAIRQGFRAWLGGTSIRITVGNVTIPFDGRLPISGEEGE
ncbi:hypothetical protein [Croceicoccus sp. YJ47]|uniref:hypothetical protein n=1 Tax=Croceicoccus sp. YJ47 TaxID=2798724 RepID=UPI001923D51F|nr:hypothetical protein [Croceicoccus sp. YJ47]QQN73941.1 hypothetical protein JD971_14520 [Croceicoccus sp. YJ47]